jgi:hypothetical protein
LANPTLRSVQFQLFEGVERTAVVGVCRAQYNSPSNCRFVYGQWNETGHDKLGEHTREPCSGLVSSQAYDEFHALGQLDWLAASEELAVTQGGAVHKGQTTC